MSGDITDILRGWSFDSDDQVRIIKAKDGRDVLQVRQPLGIEQYELDGRPDGTTPENKESYLHVFQDRLQEYITNNATDEGFSISHEEFGQLQNEGILYYYRYLVLFQISEFPRTARDTEHNLQLCDLIEKYAENEEDKKEILQYRPYILRMYAVSKAMVSLHKQLKSTARKILQSAIDEIETMPDIDTPAFQFERVRSLNYLKSTLKQINEDKGTPLERLRKELSEAVENENYERAAQLRDRIKALEKEGS
jgi:hypothetical protein